MPKLIDTKKHEYCNYPETWLVEPISSSQPDIDAELAEIPSNTPAGSLAEVLLSTGLKVMMKNSGGDWIEI